MKKHRNSGMSSGITIDFIEKNQQKKYVEDLEKLTQQYEKIIEGNILTIQELHERVYEYLGDAIEK